MKRNVVAEKDANDDEPINDQPAEKIVKTDSESALHEEVLELRKKVAKLESDYQGACRIAGVAQARVEFLESLIDNKPTTSDGKEKSVVTDLQKINVADTEKQLSNELQKKIACLTEQLEAEKLRAEEERTIVIARIDDLTLKHNQEVEQAREDRVHDLTRVAELSTQLKDAGSEKANSEDHWLQRVNTLTKQLGEAEERCERISEEKKKNEEMLAETSTQLKVAKKETAKREEYWQERVHSLTKLLETESARASEERKKEDERWTELLAKLSETEREAEQTEEYYQERVHDLKKQLEEMETYYREKVNDLKNQLEDVSSQAIQKRRSQDCIVNSLTKQLEEKESRASEDRKFYEARLSELSEKLRKAKKANEERKKNAKRIDKFTDKPAECEKNLQSQATTSREALEEQGSCLLPREFEEGEVED